MSVPMEHVKRRFLEAAMEAWQTQEDSGILKWSPPSRSIWTTLDCPSTRISSCRHRSTQKHGGQTHSPIQYPGMKNSVNRGHQERVYRVNLGKFLSHPPSSFPLRTSLSNRRTYTFHTSHIVLNFPVVLRKLKRNQQNSLNNVLYLTQYIQSNISA